MNNDFEKTLDEIIKKWPEQVGNYTWEEMFGGAYGNDVKLHVLNRLHDDGLIKQSNSGQPVRYFLNSMGHDIKRHIDSKGYVARLKENHTEKNISESTPVNKDIQNKVF